MNVAVIVVPIILVIVLVLLVGEYYIHIQNVQDNCSPRSIHSCSPRSPQSCSSSSCPSSSLAVALHLPSSPSYRPSSSSSPSSIVPSYSPSYSPQLQPQFYIALVLPKGQNQLKLEVVISQNQDQSIAAAHYSPALCVHVFRCVAAVVVLLCVWKCNKELLKRYCSCCQFGSSKTAIHSMQQENQRLRHELSQHKVSLSGRFQPGQFCEQILKVIVSV